MDNDFLQKTANSIAVESVHSHYYAPGVARIVVVHRKVSVKAFADVKQGRNKAGGNGAAAPGLRQK